MGLPIHRRPIEERRAILAFVRDNLERALAMYREREPAAYSLALGTDQDPEVFVELCMQRMRARLVSSGPPPDLGPEEEGAP
jgi:hypothetical protein